jgi:hypothetical protein
MKGILSDGFLSLVSKAWLRLLFALLASGAPTDVIAQNAK